MGATVVSSGNRLVVRPACWLEVLVIVHVDGGRGFLLLGAINYRCMMHVGGLGLYPNRNVRPIARSLRVASIFMQDFFVCWGVGMRE